MMRTLIDRGHAYAADGNVYFDVRSFPQYLELSRQELDNLLQPSGEGETGKRDPRDFAMWKAAKPGERPGPPRGARAGRAGTWSAPPWRTSTWAAPSTSTAAAST